MRHGTFDAGHNIELGCSGFEADRVEPVFCISSHIRDRRDLEDMVDFGDSTRLP
jgi:hypothetical protein